VSGRSIEDWYKWKEAITDRFKIKLTLSEFIQFQAKRTLHSNEAIADYIYIYMYDKDAIIDKAPLPLQQADRVSLILQGITEHEWAIPLTTAMCTSVKDLIDLAVTLDAIRRYQYKKNNIPSSKSIDNQKKHDNYIPRFNPTVDKKEQQTCYKCKQVGHISYNCKNPTSEKGQQNQNKSDSKHNTINKTNNFNKEAHTTKTINCVQNDCSTDDLVKVSQIPDTINGNMIHRRVT